jgi:large subunit ribosomal protein L2
MAVRGFKPTSPARRHMTVSTFEEITTSKPEKSLVVSLKKHSGRNNQGKITIRHRGGGNKIKYRIIDSRDKRTAFLQKFLQSNMIQIDLQTSL